MVDEYWIRSLIRDGKLWKFYKTKEWMQLRDTIMQENHNECEWCRERGRISRATEVHHIQYVKRHPELALSRFYYYKGEQYKNLVALCHDCHDKAHGRMRHKAVSDQFNEERW